MSFSQKLNDDVFEALEKGELADAVGIVVAAITALEQAHTSAVTSLHRRIELLENERQEREATP